MHRAYPAYRLHSAGPAPAGLRAAIPAWVPLPAWGFVAGPFRLQDPALRREKQGVPIGNRTGGKPGTPPPPENRGPVPGFPPDLLSCLPKRVDPAVPMTAEGASKTGAHDRVRYRGALDCAAGRADRAVSTAGGNLQAGGEAGVVRPAGAPTAPSGEGTIPSYVGCGRARRAGG
jgi:hypothetical protein